MTTSVMYALITVFIVGALMLVAVQVRQLIDIKQRVLTRQQQYLDELHQPYRCSKCGVEEAATSKSASARVKHAKRQARIRKGSGHNA